MSDSVALFLLSLVLLGVGAEGFARGLGRIGLPARLRLLAMGLSFSAPVLAVSFTAGFGGYPRTAVAILAGSLIANIGLVLSVATLAQPLAGMNPSLRTAILLLIGASLLALFLVRDNTLSKLDGGILLAFAIGVGVLLTRHSPPNEPLGSSPRPSWVGVVIALAGLGWMIGAAALLVTSSMEGVVKFAEVGGVVFGLTAVAAGIALRAIVASIVAARKGEGNQVLGGVIVGSLINLLVGLGMLGVGVPMPIPDRMVMEVFPAAVIATLLLVAIRMNDLRTRRGEALIHLVAYVAFVVWLARSVSASR